jgi:hypothetical protein
VKFEANRTLFRDLTQQELDELEPELVKWNTNTQNQTWLGKCSGN